MNMLPPSYIVMDITYQPNAIYSIWKRIGPQLPGLSGAPLKWGVPARMPLGCPVNVDEETHQDFLLYAQQLVEQHFPRLKSPDFSLESYVQNVNRSKEYTDDLIRAVIDEKTIGQLHAFNFLKYEFYSQGKFPRTISALSDNIKCTFGPIFRELDYALFHSDLSKYFVKTVPVKERARHIQEMFGMQQVCLADFSSFECCHRGVFGRAVWFAFEHMIGSSIPEELKRVLARLFCGVKYAKFETLKVEFFVEGTLMSGAPWTSSANAVLNFMILSYLRLRDKYPGIPPDQLAARLKDFTGVIEGDDSLTLGGAYNQRILTGLGLPCLSEVHDNFATASFCGIIKPLDVDTNLTDPRKVLSTFFWLPMNMIGASEKNQKGYMRAKALSYYYQYDGCPIVAWLAYVTLEKTKSHHVFRGHDYGMGFHRQTVLAEALASGDKFWMRKPVIDDASRILVAQLFEISIDEQFEIEESLRSWAKGGAVWLPPVFEKYARNTEVQMALDEWPDPSKKSQSKLPELELLRDMWYCPASGRAATKAPHKAPGRCLNPIFQDNTYYPAPAKNERKKFILDPSLKIVQHD